MNNFKYSLNTLLILVFLITIHYTSPAIPAFARKYKTSCATCHIAVSKRNAFGEAFRRNGYVMTTQNARLIKEAPLKLGAEAWKEVWPEAIWPSDIPGSFPIAAYTHLRAEYHLNNPDKSSNHLDFSMPYDFSFMLGGAFGEDIGFFGAWSSAFGLNRLYFILNDLAGPKNLFNLKMGQFIPGILDGYLPNQRLTMEMNILQAYAPGGTWEPYDSQSGIEINGIAFHNLQYCIGVVNGEGAIRSDIDNDKDYYTRIAYKFLGFGLDGDGIMKDSSVNDYGTDNSVTIGVFSYFGNYLKFDKSGKSFNNAFTRYGVDVRIRLGDLDFLSGLIAGNDPHPFDTVHSLTSLAAYVEGDYIFYPWLIGVLRLESAHSHTGSSNVNYYRVIPNVCILIRQNVRFSLEGLFVLNENKIKGSVQTVYDRPFQWIKFNGLFAF